MNRSQTHEVINASLRKVTAALRDADVPFMLGGSVACWARGGPRSQNHVDLMVPREDAERALATLSGLGMRTERPPEEWLLKAWDGDVGIELICTSLGLGDITTEMIDQAEEMSVLAIRMPVMAVEDVLVGKLLAISEQRLDYGPLLEIARGLRERIRWRDVRRHTENSPYARTFFSLLGELDVIAPTSDRAAGLQVSAAERGGSLMVFGAQPLLTVTVETGGENEPEIHLHAGGQGVWVARMAALLGANVQLCAALGGEPGQVLRPLLESEGIDLRAVHAEAPNGVYIHDRRSGEREPVAETHAPQLSRHELDALYGLAIASGLETGVALLTGSADTAMLGADFYRRLARDLRENGTTVVADVSGDQLRGALDGGIDLLKISDEQLVEAGYAPSDDEHALVAGLRRLREAGAANVLVSRAADPALACVDSRLLKLTPPRLAALDPRGSGDSQSAAIAVALARGQAVREALVLGMAAGALNVTRRGLGSGDREAIESLVDQIELVEMRT